MAKRKRSSKSCHVGTVKFQTKRGRTVSFKGHVGPDCGPRKKPSTAHLRAYKTAMGRAARHCKGRKGQAFKNCVSSNIPR